MWTDPHYLLADAHRHQHEIRRDIAHWRTKRTDALQLRDVVNVWIAALHVTAAYVRGQRPEPTS